MMMRRRYVDGALEHDLKRGEAMTKPEQLALFQEADVEQLSLFDGLDAVSISSAFVPDMIAFAALAAALNALTSMDKARLAMGKAKTAITSLSPETQQWIRREVNAKRREEGRPDATTQEPSDVCVTEPKMGSGDSDQETLLESLRAKLAAMTPEQRKVSARMVANKLGLVIMPAGSAYTNTEDSSES